MSARCFAVDALRGLARDLLRAAGMDEEKAAVTAELLLEADLMGHTTHGLALLPAYRRELEAGRLLGTGEPATLADGAAVAVWDGGWRPGLWLAAR
ncbi:MAG: Ldh family oxidoreductase, partial [Geminicoccaceae bacterium]|nr:Ldh family oxidoreductase [Geminicoccaceae bacterium]